MSETRTVSAPAAREARTRLLQRFGFKTGDQVGGALRSGRRFDEQSMSDIVAGFGKHKRVANALPTNNARS